MTFDIKTVLEYIKSVLESTASASVKALKQSTFKVDVQNKEFDTKITNKDPIKVSGDVSIKNLKDNTRDWIELQRVLDQVPELLKKLDKDQTVSVKSLPEIKFPKTVEVSNHPKKMEISNLDAIHKALVQLKGAIDELPKTYPDIKFPEIKIPEYPKFPEINIPEYPKFPETMSVKDLDKLIKLAEKITKGDAKEPLSVRLSDGEKFYKAITEVLTSGGTGIPFTFKTGVRESALLTTNREQAVATAERFNNNDIDSPNANLTYIGQEDLDGVWLIQRVLQTGTINSFRYATIKNNSNKSTYDQAWSARASLSYGKVREAL